ncbi:hypothetical protein STEG23_020101, partial [Scotinomys teguina]
TQVNTYLLFQTALSICGCAIAAKTDLPMFPVEIRAPMPCMCTEEYIPRIGNSVTSSYSVVLHQSLSSVSIMFSSSDIEMLDPSFSPMTDGSRMRDPQPITRQRSRSPVKKREYGFYEQVHQDHDGETCRDNQTKLEETHESWINGCGAYIGLN